MYSPNELTSWEKLLLKLVSKGAIPTQWEKYRNANKIRKNQFGLELKVYDQPFARKIRNQAINS